MRCGHNVVVNKQCTEAATGRCSDKKVFVRHVSPGKLELFLFDLMMLKIFVLLGIRAVVMDTPGNPSCSDGNYCETELF